MHLFSLLPMVVSGRLWGTLQLCRTQFQNHGNTGWDARNRTTNKTCTVDSGIFQFYREVNR